jgi:hypothetical protein
MWRPVPYFHPSILKSGSAAFCGGVASYLGSICKWPLRQSRRHVSARNSSPRFPLESRELNRTQAIDMETGRPIRLLQLSPMGGRHNIPSSGPNFRNSTPLVYRRVSRNKPEIAKPTPTKTTAFSAVCGGLTKFGVTPRGGGAAPTSGASRRPRRSPGQLNCITRVTQCNANRSERRSPVAWRACAEHASAGPDIREDVEVPRTLSFVLWPSQTAE